MKEVIKISETVVDSVKQQTNDLRQVVEDTKNAAKVLKAYAEGMPDPGSVVLRCFKNLVKNL